MKTTASSLLPALVACAGLAHAAAAQCDIFWPGIPDFDQRRVYVPGLYVGLDENGANYCVPTSSADLCAVLDSHGFNVMPGISTQSWYQQNPLYNQIGTFLDTLGGDYMGTGGINSSGTTFSGGVDGFQDWFDHCGYGDTFSVQGYQFDGENFPKAAALYNRMKAGHLTSFCFGRWYRDGDQLERDGGHCLALCGAYDACNDTRPQILYHDPNTGDPTIYQEDFRITTRQLYRRYFNMDGDWAHVYAFEETSNGTSTQAVNIIDSFRWILSNESIGSHPINPNILRVFRLAGVWHATGGMQEIPSPTGGPILDAAHSYIDHTYLILCGAGQSRAGLYRFNPADGSSRRLVEFTRNPDRMLVDRFGHVMLQAGLGLTRYGFDEAGAAVAEANQNLPWLPQGWTYDDASDQVIAINTSTARVARIPRALTGAVAETSLPPALTLSGEGSATIHPISGHLWITSVGSPSAYEIEFDANGRTLLRSQAGGASFVHPRGLWFNRSGHMFAACDGSVRILRQSAAGGWVPVTDGVWSQLGTMGMGRVMEMTRSRKADTLRQTGPRWEALDLVDFPSDAPVIPECAADFNLDGFLDFFDYDDFVRCFEGRGCPRGRDADFNMDGFVDFFDLDAYTEAFERGC